MPFVDLDHHCCFYFSVLQGDAGIERAEKSQRIFTRSKVREICIKSVSQVSHAFSEAIAIIMCNTHCILNKVNNQ